MDPKEQQVLVAPKVKLKKNLSGYSFKEYDDLLKTSKSNDSWFASRWLYHPLAWPDAMPSIPLGLDFGDTGFVQGSFDLSLKLLEIRVDDLFHVAQNVRQPAAGDVGVNDDTEEADNAHRTNNHADHEPDLWVFEHR